MCSLSDTVSISLSLSGNNFGYRIHWSPYHCFISLQWRRNDGAFSYLFHSLQNNSPNSVNNSIFNSFIIIFYNITGSRSEITVNLKSVNHILFYKTHNIKVLLFIQILPPFFIFFLNTYIEYRRTNKDLDLIVRGRV